MPDHSSTVHTLTLDFGRLLTAAEWYAVISKVKKLPHVRSIRVDEVCRCGEIHTTTTKRRTTTTI